MTYDAAMFSRQYPVVVFFVQHIAYYRGLHARFDEITAHRDFWRSTCDAHLKLATVSWCNVFGSYKEDLHWTKTPAAAVADLAVQEFRQRILSHTGFTQETWQAYHKSMLDFRDKYVAHLDLRTPFAQPVPSLDPAIQTAYAYQEWARELIRPVLLNQPALRAEYAQWERGRVRSSGLHEGRFESAIAEQGSGADRRLAFARRGSSPPALGSRRECARLVRWSEGAGTRSGPSCLEEN